MELESVRCAKPNIAHRIDIILGDRLSNDNTSHDRSSVSDKLSVLLFYRFGSTKKIQFGSITVREDGQ